MKLVRNEGTEATTVDAEDENDDVLRDSVFLAAPTLD